jgi:cobalt-zinc-cadmium resistance protein CzcA
MNQIVAFAVKQRAFMVLLLLVTFVAGLLAFAKLDIEAYPDPIPPLVEVTTQSNGQSAAEVERYITIPIEMQLSGMPYVTRIDSTSLFGLSDIEVHFTYHYTYHEAEQRVIDRLSQLGPLPNGATPQISPESAIGEIYRYRIVGPPGYSVTDLKTIQDWIVKPRLLAIPGILGVGGWAGKTRTYAVTVDENKLLAYGLTIPQIVHALKNADLNVGGQTIDFGAQQAVVRGVGLIRSMAQIRNTMVSANNGSPIRIKDVAAVTVGHEPRLGIVGYGNDNDIVQGIVLMRHGGKTLPTLRRVEAEVRKINTTGILPPGIKLVPFYDRSHLIAVTTATVLRNMVTGIVLIFFIQWVFLGDLRSAVVVGATVPFALFFAIIIMTLRGESANLLSVGAIDFGLIVDATVIMVENICRHLREGAGGPALMPFAARRDAGLRGKPGAVLRAAAEVNRAVFFSAAIIVAGFVPLFTLSGVEGHIFGPMAETYAYAIIGGLLATFTVSPALSALLLPERVSEVETVVVRALRRLYHPILEFALANRILTLGGTLIVAAMAALLARALGLTFLPTLDEGNLWIRASMPPTISLKEGERYVNRMRHLIESFPEVGTVLSQLGRPDDGTGTNPTSDAEFYAPFKPRAEWPKGVDRAALIHQMDTALKARFPGVDFNFSQYIEDNIDQAFTGINGANAVKLFGHDLRALQKTAHRIAAVLATVPGMTDIGVFNAWGQPTVNIAIDRQRAARYGLSPGAINATVQAAIGGEAAGDLYEHGSDRHFPIVVRLARRYRDSLSAIRRIPIGAHSGTGIIPIPLGAVAKVSLGPGYSFIHRENEQRYIPIKFSVRGRPLASAVFEAQRRIARQIRLPAGAHLVWVGEFGELQRALRRLAVIVPVSLALIGLLLFINFGSLVDTLVAASVMPMAWIGGVFALSLSGTPFSVSAAIGFVALFGVSVMEGIIILSYFNALIDAGLARADAILRACHIRLRPVLMTCMAGFVGLLPAALSTGIGSQVQKPLAIVVVGGILLAPVLILVVLPVLIDLFSRRHEPVAAAQPVPGE